MTLAHPRCCQMQHGTCHPGKRWDRSPEVQALGWTRAAGGCRGLGKGRESPRRSCPSIPRKLGGACRRLTAAILTVGSPRARGSGMHRPGQAGVARAGRAAERTRGTGWRSLSAETAGAPLCAWAAHARSTTGTMVGGQGSQGDPRPPPHPSLQPQGRWCGSPARSPSRRVSGVFLRAASTSRSRMRKEEAVFRKARKFSHAQNLPLTSLKKRMRETWSSPDFS